MRAPRLLLMSGLLFACRSSGSPDPGGGGSGGTGTPVSGAGTEFVQNFDLNPIRDVDLLFVVANTPGMAARQEQLARALPALFEELGKGEGGLPDLHVGVISGDLGAGSIPMNDCQRPGGDRAIFQNGGGACGLQGQELFLSSLQSGTQNNFTGALPDVVGCLVQKLGEKGCPYSHALQATRVALYESVTRENAGFLRDSAYLGIILLTDRDDCSGDTTSDLYVDNASFPMTEKTLRCSQVGHLCDGKSPAVGPFSAPLAGCSAREGGRLIRVNEIVDSVRALKKRPDAQIFVAAIAGSPDDHAGATYQYAAGADGLVAETPLCGSGTAATRVGLRLRAALNGFGARGKMFDACADLAAPVRGIGTWLNTALKRMCLASPPLDVDPATAGVQVSCQAMLRVPDHGQFEERAIPACGDGGPRPCLALQAEPDCTTSGASFSIDQTGAPQPPGTQVAIRCAAESKLAPPGPPPAMCTGNACLTRRSLGQSCTVTDAPPALYQAVYRTDAPECKSGICLRPARDVAVAKAVDTGATCSKSCAVDADCLDAEARDPSNGLDKRCLSGYACAVPFEVGSLCCRRLCVCKDFLPAAGTHPPASCLQSSAASVCPNRL